MIELAGVHDPAQAAAIIGKTAQLELYDLDPALVPPSRQRSGSDHAVHEPLQPAHARAVAGGQTGMPTGYYLFTPKKTTTTTGTGKKKKTTTTSDLPPRRRPCADAASRQADRRAGLLDAYGGKVPTG